MSLLRYCSGRWPLFVVWLALCSTATAASFMFLSVEGVFNNPPSASAIQPYAIVLSSSSRRFIALPPDGRPLLQEYFIYQTRVSVEDQTYYRLALGNFSSERTARIELQRLQKSFAEAWIYRRNPEEEKQLAKFLGQSRAPVADVPAPVRAPAAPIAADSSEPPALLEQARQEFIDENYARVIAITDRISATGDLIQAREALELAGITRERQRKFAQAIVLYEALLDTEPEPETRLRIESRLEGIRTMSLTPKTRIANDTGRAERSPWSSRGMLMQFYQDDMIDNPGQDLTSVNRVLVTDLNLFVQHRTDTDKLELRLDAGLVNDFIDDDSESRIATASIEYARDEFRLVGGRQRRTLTGVYGGFDGLSFTDLSHSGFQLAAAYGYVAQSSFSDFNSDQPFIGANLNLAPYAWLDTSFFLIHQEVSGLTDRESIGSEIRYHNDGSFVYGFIDYDLFYKELNNLSLNSNFQLAGDWTLNLSLSLGYSPTLSTLSSLQGQTVATIDELKDIFSNDEIYQLAQDRSSQSQNLFAGASYRFDATRHLYFYLSALKLEATEASGGVEGIPSSDYLQLAVDYSFQGLLTARDYATLGGGISSSTTGEILSVRARSRFGDSHGISYDPRIQLDFRKNKRDGGDQFILKPSFKVIYRSSNRLSFEGIFGLEYSDLNLPELEEQYTYSLYLGYYYSIF
ncbi:MAG TPA: hypothetical protein VMZ32_10545 [Gammaproteobacteria bacterium]|nr:hypothetical protein [Gammaproteobacteria bacterium]